MAFKGRQPKGNVSLIYLRRQGYIGIQGSLLGVFTWHIILPNISILRCTCPCQGQPAELILILVWEIKMVGPGGKIYFNTLK